MNNDELKTFARKLKAEQWQEFRMKFLPMIDGTLAARAREEHPPAEKETLTDKICNGRLIIMTRILRELDEELSPE